MPRLLPNAEATTECGEKDSSGQEISTIFNMPMNGINSLDIGGADGTRTRDPRRDRPVF